MFQVLSVTPHLETMELYRPDSIGVRLLLPGISHGGVNQGTGNQGISQNDDLTGSRTCPGAVTVETSDNTYDDMKFPPRWIASNIRAENFNWSLTVSSWDLSYMRE